MWVSFLSPIKLPPFIFAQRPEDFCPALRGYLPTALGQMENGCVVTERLRVVAKIAVARLIDRRKK